MLVGPVRGIAIAGGGVAWPARVVDNVAALRTVVRDLDDERVAFMAKEGVADALGIERRAWAHVPGTPFDHATEETTATLAVRAARAALADAGVGDVPLVICATATPPRMTSSIAAFVGAELGMRAACIDIRTGCSGGLVALLTASLYLAAGTTRVLVIGSETFSKIIPKASKVAAVTLGDGAAAVVVERRDEDEGAITGFMETDGALGVLATAPGALPPTHDEIDRGAYELAGEPDELAAVVPGKYAEAIQAVLRRTDTSAAEIDLFVPHQTTRPLIEAVAEKAGIAREKIFTNVAEHANVGSAALLGALVEARAAGRVPKRKRVLMAVVGGGMTWASAILET